ncbi:zinc-containing alcohol dehydrogenase superfamily protein [Pseudomonas aeruginosa]|nr:zinc-containing alcohol dehydrogenase superfamily protein [Pseudomonas aeruginosa]
MKAYVIEQAGGPEVLRLRDIASPEPNANEVRIRVRAFGLNRAELYRRAGKMGPITGPVVPGIEAVGEVLLDPSGRFRVGQRVATAMGGLQFSRNGSYAEEVTVLRSNVLALPDTYLSWEELAALPQAYLTIWGALDRSLAIQPGQTLLVRGATSSVGLAALTYAKARGLRVLASTRSAENTERLRQLGADLVFVDNGELSASILAALPEGVDAALEVVGAPTLRDSVRSLRPFGSVCVIGLLGGPPSLERFQLMQDLPGAARLSFFPSDLLGGAYLDLGDSPLGWVVQELASGRLPSLLSATFDFDDLPAPTASWRPIAPSASSWSASRGEPTMLHIPLARLALPFLCTTLSPFAAHAAAADPTIEAAVTRQLERYEEALNASDVDAVMRLYARDPVFMPQHSLPRWAARRYARPTGRCSRRSAWTSTSASTRSARWARTGPSPGPAPTVR